MARVKLTFIFVCFLSLANFAYTANILMNAMLGEGSHFLCAASIGERLVRRGHNVTFLVSNAYAHWARNVKYADIFNFEIFRHPVPVEKVYEQYNAFNARAFESAATQLLTLTEVIRDGRALDCDSLLSDEAFMKRIARGNFSIIIYDIGWYCPILLAESLDIPYIALSAVSSPCTITESAGSVFLPSYVPEIFTGLSNRLNFKERFQNTVAHLFIRLFSIYFNHPYEMVKDKHGVAPGTSLTTLFAKSRLFLVNVDFAVEYSCPMPPSVVPVGGLTTRPADALPAELEQFVQDSGEHGIIVCTLGTYFTAVPFNVVQQFVIAFGKVPQKVIWQLRTIPPGVTIPPNVMISPWLPQNDLLGHNKTRAFLYQGGNNGFYEALYHGVPIVVIPIHGDQYDTGSRVTSNGLGVSIDKATITGDIIYRALRDVTTNVSYAQTARKLSAMFRDRPLVPAERAAFWIEHVIKHDGSKYQSPSVDLSTVEYYLLDVLCLFCGVLLTFAMILFTCCRKVLSVVLNIFSRQIHKQKDD